MQKKIPFSPPDMSEAEIQEVAEALKSGWITTGPKTKEFENLISLCCQTTVYNFLIAAPRGLLRWTTTVWPMQ